MESSILIKDTMCACVCVSPHAFSLTLSVLKVNKLKKIESLKSILHSPSFIPVIYFNILNCPEIPSFLFLAHGGFP